jgi:hypothetical protein
MVQQEFTKDKDRDCVKTFNNVINERGKIIFSNIGFKNGHGDIITLDYSKEDLQYLTYYDKEKKSIRTDSNGKVDPFHLFYLLEDKSFNSYEKTDSSGNYVGFSKFLQELENDIEEPICLDMNVSNDYLFKYDEPTKKNIHTVLSINDFIQCTIIELNYHRDLLINKLYVYDNNKWIPYSNIISKLNLMGENSNNAPVCIIKEFVVDGISFKSITTLDIEELSEEEKFAAFDSRYNKFRFITDVIVTKLN